MDTISISKPGRSVARAFVIAWGLGCCFYFLEYVVRASPAVMIPELSGGLGITALEMSAILGAYYYTYSVTSLIAGVALDHAGARYPVSIGVGILAVGCLLFGLHAFLPAGYCRVRAPPSPLPAASIWHRTVFPRVRWQLLLA